MRAELEQIGGRLRAERIRLGHNQKEMAELCGVHVNSVLHYEKGERAANLAFLLILRDIGVDIAYILTGVHESGEIGVRENLILSMFSKLSEREKDAVMALIGHLAGQTFDFPAKDPLMGLNR